MTNKVKLSEITGKNLKRIIKEHGLTQEKFASMINVEDSTLRRWLAYGLNSIDTLQMVAEALNVSPLMILGV